MSWLNDGIPERVIDPPSGAEAMCHCGHCFDDHNEDGTCSACECAEFEEYTEEDAEMEYGDLMCDERREGVYD